MKTSTPESQPPSKAERGEPESPDVVREELVKVGIRLSESHHRLAQLLATRENVSMARFLELILAAELDRRASEAARAAQETLDWVLERFPDVGDREGQRQPDKVGSS